MYRSEDSLETVIICLSSYIRHLSSMEKGMTALLEDLKLFQENGGLLIQVEGSGQIEKSTDEEMHV